MSIKVRVLEVVSQFSTLSPVVADRVAQEVATEYGRAQAAGQATAGKLSGSVKAGQATVKDASGILLPATPCVRLFLACCILRDAADKVASPKGAYQFKVPITAKLECPGLEKAFAPVEQPESAPA